MTAKMLKTSSEHQQDTVISDSLMMTFFCICDVRRRPKLAPSSSEHTNRTPTVTHKNGERLRTTTMSLRVCGSPLQPKSYFHHLKIEQKLLKIETSVTANTTLALTISKP
jgi:hypothetical protein